MEAKGKAEALRSIYEAIKDVAHGYSIKEHHRSYIEMKVRGLYNSIQEELSISNIQREGYKKQFESCMEIIRGKNKEIQELQEKLKSSISMPDYGEELLKREKEIVDLQEKNRELKEKNYVAAQFNKLKNGDIQSLETQVKEQGEEIERLKEELIAEMKLRQDREKEWSEIYCDKTLLKGEIVELREKNQSAKDQFNNLAAWAENLKNKNIELSEEIENQREAIKCFLEGFIEFVETEPEVYQRKKAQMDAIKLGFESIKDQWINNNL